MGAIEAGGTWGDVILLGVVCMLPLLVDEQSVRTIIYYITRIAADLISAAGQYCHTSNACECCFVFFVFSPRIDLEMGYLFLIINPKDLHLF